MVQNTTSKDILVKLKYIVEGREKLEQQKKGLQNLQTGLENVSSSMLKQQKVNKFFRQQMARTGKTGAEIQKGMSGLGAQFNEFGEVVNMGGNRFQGFNKQLDQSIKSSQKFKMEHLGVMFAGMALQRTFAGLTQTAKDWVGMNEIMSTTMGIVTLPAVLGLLENGILPLSEALMNLPEPIQGVIGAVALLGEGLGGSLMVFGQVALGLSSFKLAFPGITAKIVAMTSAIFSLNGAIGLFGIALAAVAIGSYVKSLAEYSKAWNDLGESVESTTDILGQAGQMTRTIDKSIELTPEQTSAVNEAFNEVLKDTGAEPYNFDFIGPRQQSEYEKNLPTLSSMGLPEFVPPPSYAVGGMIPNNGMYNLHQGEQVLRKDQAQGEQAINVIYNVTASSMKEFESRLRESERRITSDIRRMAR